MESKTHASHLFLCIYWSLTARTSVAVHKSLYHLYNIGTLLSHIDDPFRPSESTGDRLYSFYSISGIEIIMIGFKTNASAMRRNPVEMSIF